MRTIVLVLAGVMMASCAAPPELSDEERVEVHTVVMDAASMLGISLDTDQADCVVDRLGAEAARETVANDPGPELATPIVNCVGADQIGFIALQPLAPAASEDSIRCAAARLDNEFVTALVARAFDPDQMMPQGLELEVTSALAMCLTPGEVLTS